jgi:hypothetical protein
MKLQTLFGKLQKSEEFLDFKEKNPNAFFCAGFFILNFKQNLFEYFLDYRDDKKLFAFKIPEFNEKIIFTAEDLIENPKPMEKLEEKEIKNIKTDLDDLKEILEQALWDNNIKNSLEEFIAVLQCLNGKILWNITCICSNLAIVNANIEPFTGNILKFEKKNLLDFASIKKVDKK